MGVEEILIGFVISVVAGGFIYIITKDKNIKQNNKNGDNTYIQGNQIINNNQTKESDPKKS